MKKWICHNDRISIIVQITVIVIPFLYKTSNVIKLLLFKDLFTYLKGIVKQRERQRKMSCFTFQMVAISQA